MARGIPASVLRYFQQIPLFADVSKAGLRKIVGAATELPVRAGRILLSEGELGRELYVIVEGNARATKGGRKLSDMGPGDFVGEFAFLDGSPRSATVTAVSDMRVMVLSRHEFSAIVEQEPAIAHRILQAMARRVRQSERSPTH
jgi:CRP/FNR family transcriptional regulator, cyclic AMP receptor protein